MFRAIALAFIFFALFFTVSCSRLVWRNGTVRVLSCIGALVALAAGLLVFPESEEYSWLYLMTAIGVAWWSRYGWLHYDR